MVHKDVARPCPYCGTLLVLDDCAVVSTYTQGLRLGGGFASQGEANTGMMPSGTKPIGTIRGYQLLRLAKQPGESSRFARAFGQLIPLLDEFSSADIPRRMCSSCKSPLPLELDDHDAFILAVVGLNRAGKSYFIGAAFSEATRNDGLYDFGVESIRALDDTPGRLHQEYFQTLFRGSHSIDVTPVDAHLEKPPLTFLVKMRGSKPFVLVTHDVSGEALMNRQSRAATANFISRANAVIFLADPLDMSQVADRLPQEADAIGMRSLDQGALLEATLQELRPFNKQEPPLALTVSKSDLISDAFGKPYSFNVHRPGKDWKQEIRSAGEEVRSLLLEANERKLVRLTDNHAPSSFHAISVLGTAEARHLSGGRPQPVRVLDPLGTVLEQLRLGQVNDN